MYFGNKDTGMHTGFPWALPARGTGPELCVIYDCEQPESAPVHQRGYVEGGHQFLSEATADEQDEAERDAEAAYDTAMNERGW